MPPEPLLPQLARRGRVIVVNDEAHHLHDEVRSDTGDPLVARRLRSLGVSLGVALVGHLVVGDGGARLVD